MYLTVYILLNATEDTLFSTYTINSYFIHDSKDYNSEYSCSKINKKASPIPFS
jgi:hypothetical protein